MTFAKFLTTCKKEIDGYITKKTGDPPINANDRRLWVLNDEPLYRRAKSQGARI